MSGRRSANQSLNSILRKCPQEQAHFVPPMLCGTCTVVPEGSDWRYEIKLDGYRAQAIKAGDNIKLLSRNSKALLFRQVVEAVRGLRPDSVVLDGEVVALEVNGRPSFQALQNTQLSKGCAICFYAFDILHLNGRSLIHLPLDTRLRLLRDTVEGSEVRLSEGFDAEPEVLLKHVAKFKLEGIVAKRASSMYEAGKRSGAWLKYKVLLHEDFVIGGFLPGNPVDSILVGYSDGKTFLFCGEVHGGLNRHNRRELAKTLSAFPPSECPFANLPDRGPGRWGEGITVEDMRRYIWIHPAVSVRIGYTEWTVDKRLRHPRFISLRECG